MTRFELDKKTHKVPVKITRKQNEEPIIPLSKEKIKRFEELATIKINKDNHIFDKDFDKGIMMMCNYIRIFFEQG